MQMSHSCKIYNTRIRLHHEFFDWEKDFTRIFQFIENYLCFLYLTSDLMKIFSFENMKIVQFIHKQGRSISLSSTDLIGNCIYPFRDYAILYKINQEEKLRTILSQNPLDTKESKPPVLMNWPIFLVLFCFDKKKITIFI